MTELAAGTSPQENPFLLDDPFLQGNFAPVFDERDEAELPVTGTIPEALHGHYLRNGSNPVVPPLGAYHWFDGDGMIHGVSLQGGRAGYRNRWVRTVGFELEREAGRALYGGLANMTFPDAEVMAKEGGLFKNAANTNVIRHGGKVLALWEGGFPTELTVEGDTVGLWDFDGRLEGAMTAHPKWDGVSGELLFYGVSPFPPYLRYHVADRSGALVHSAEIDIDEPVMLHDFNVTEHYSVFFVMPAVIDIASGAGVVWKPENGTRIGILPRHGRGDEVRWITTDPFHVFHFLNAWEEGDQIVVEGCKTRALSLNFDGDRTDVPKLHRWRIDPASGAVKEEQLDDRTMEFPRLDDRLMGRPHRYGYLVASTTGTDSVGFDSVVRLDERTGTTEAYRYGEHCNTGEVVFAPDPAGSAENDGWLLSYVYDAERNASDLVILDARDMTGGPVATVHLPRRVPYGFHGNWMPAGS